MPVPANCSRKRCCCCCCWSCSPPLTHSSIRCTFRLVSLGSNTTDASRGKGERHRSSDNAHNSHLGAHQVFFYPKDSTPGCTKEACTFQADLAQYKKAGAELIGISSDADHSEFVAANGLSMTLLSDIGGKVRFFSYGRCAVTAVRCVVSLHGCVEKTTVRISAAMADPRRPPCWSQRSPAPSPAAHISRAQQCFLYNCSR